MQKSDPLVRTKLYPPFIRPGLVTRARLQKQIMQGIRGPLTLLVAPAGFGKTTLVASSLAACGLPVAWLSLDKNDNQARRFLSYLVAAVKEVDSTIGTESIRLMAEMQQISSDVILTSLVNDLDTTERELILVLDDYQFITSQAVHEDVAFLLEHCPNTIHMLIATRSDPPLPIARLRARGQMAEFRAADLRFNEVEAGQFLNEVMDLHLDPGSVATLEERTEGWIAGLQMAALSMRGRDDVDGFIRAFAGTNRFIMDFMLEEVLAREPQEIQTFLLQTSILTRLTGSLCDSLTGTSGGHEMLGNLERRNLFVISLDDKCCWYRYHHLFADLLRAQFEQRYPGQAQRLHALASTWYEIHGSLEDAIHHSLAASDYVAAARLVEAVAENAWLNGQYASILAWTKAIPAEVVQNCPWLCIWNAWACTQIGVSGAIDEWIIAAEQAMQEKHNNPLSTIAPGTTEDTQELNIEITSLRAFAISFTRDYDRAIELSESVLKNPFLSTRKVAQFTRCNVLHLLSSMYYATGNLKRAEQTCQETIKLAKEMNVTLRHLHSINKLILVNKVNGHLYRSHQLIEETLLFLEEQGFKNYFAATQLCFRKLELLYEWNQLEEFQRLLEHTLKHEMFADSPYLLVDANNLRALDLMNKKDYASSQEALVKATALARQFYIWEGLTWRTESLQVRLWLKKGDLSLASAWTSEETLDLDLSLRFPTESRAIARARILLAQDACPDAIHLLSRLCDSAEAGNRNGSLIEIHALKAIALLGMDELQQAVVEVESALALAEPEGYIRTFLDEGYPMSVLLSHVANNPASVGSKYALRLLAAFQEENGSARSMIPPMASHDHGASSDPDTSPVEPLSRRELDVLLSMALGNTNQEIARQLIVAPGTVKAHTASIYRKLDVANRTEAVARARQLGILP